MQMIRRIAAVVLTLALTPALVHAQDNTVLTVTAPSADVYKAPSNVTPIVGHASRGAVLPVSRNLGSWVKVAWPGAPDGVGYVHVTMGQLGPASGGAAPVTGMSPRASSTAAAPAPIPPARTPAPTRVVARPSVNKTPESHLLGVGGLVGPMSTIGASARAWRDDRLGFQLALTRDAMSSDLAGNRVTSMQIEPGVVYGLFDHVTDYVWLRPYVGAAVSFRRETLRFPTATGVEPVSDSGLGLRLFGGAEFTFASVPQLGLSVDLGYRRVPTPFLGFEADHLGAAIAGHWYIK
jgi:hypothetical protein